MTDTTKSEKPYGNAKSAKQVTVPDIVAMKDGDRKIASLTAYDYCTGLTADAAGADLVLVGDSLAMVVLGHEDTLSVTMDEMIHHTRATSRGVKQALLVGDMPFMSYHESLSQAVANAGRFIKEGRAQAVKLEGGAQMVPVVRAIVEAGIPVQGHIGLTPQRVIQLGGFKIQGKTAETARVLVEDAKALAEAGCFSLVVECVPSQVGEMVAKAVDIPVIGIGAGPGTDGQVLVMHDMLGLFDRFTPKFVKKYAELGPMAVEAIAKYVQEVRAGVFPGPKQSTTMDEQEFNALLKELNKNQ